MINGSILMIVPNIAFLYLLVVMGKERRLTGGVGRNSLVKGKKIREKKSNKGGEGCAGNVKIKEVGWRAKRIREARIGG